MSDLVVAVLGRGVVPADTPLLRADDLGVLRGDGVFETLHVRAGEPWLLDRHLTRMATSAARLDLPLPPAAELTELATTACAAWPATREGALRLICTRGAEHSGVPTVYATVAPVPDSLRATRRAGVRVASVTLGVSATARPTAPWLLGGVKSLSYAVNMASLRWATKEGVDDVLWVSSDGFLLEAPTSTLVWLEGETLCTVPPAETGILPGTTARWLLERATDLGWKPAERMARPAELHTTDGVWLTSSVRGAVPIRSLDGAALPHSSRTAAVQDLLGYPV